MQAGQDTCPGPVVLAAAAALPGWAWWGVSFVLCTGFEMLRARRRMRAGTGAVGDGWGLPDRVAMAGLWLSLLLLLLSAVIDLGHIDLGRSLTSL